MRILTELMAGFQHQNVYVKKKVLSDKIESDQTGLLIKLLDAMHKMKQL